MWKQPIQSLLYRCGYTLRSLGPASTLTGVDPWRDIQVLLGGRSHCVLFDVGANIGQTIDELRAAFHEPRIVAFEPSPQSFARLRARHGTTPGVTLEQIALGVEAETVPFHVTVEHSVNDSLLRPLTGIASTIVTVPADTVDRYCVRHGLTHIDLLKIDAQGADLRILQSTGTLLRAGRVGVYMVEVICRPIYDGQPTLIEFLQFAACVGYQPIGFYENWYMHNQLSHINVCFTRAQ